MSRPIRLSVLAFLVAGLAFGIWLICYRTPIAAPPTLVDPSDVDPVVAQLVASTVGEIKRSPRRPDVRARLAMIYHANGMPTLAQTTYEQTAMLDRLNPRYPYHLALLRADQGDVVAAIELIDHAISLQPTYAPSHWRRGFWLLDLERLDEAERSFRQAAQLDPKHSAPQVGLARIALQRKQYSQAAESLKQIIAVDPASPSAPYLRQLQGSAQRHLGPNPTTQIALAQARGQGPIWSDPWQDEISQYRTGYRAAIEGADQLTMTGQAPLAITRLRQLLESHPNDETALNYLADAYFVNRQWDQGRRVLEQCIAAHPGSYAAHLNLSRAHQVGGDFVAALDHAQRSVAINPAFGPGHIQVAQLHVLNKDYALAVEPFTTGINTGSGDPEVRIALGQVYLELRQWEQASRLFQQAIRAAPHLATGYTGLARAKAELGALQDAQAMLRIARQVNPREPTIDTVTHRLQQLQESGPNLENE
ncbi:MAG: tetratricopeptide repeat protein [Phycisphaerales bacterium]|nr:tetratricopeptide repeat protein [Phycisphaerales bacterium]MCI0630243.1 tetratricopeptide repeat protein [Phycisphaerales bacterium]MCI0675164.1 tetratricopeptide repeat protein [Phycisphaerales bacterium]